MIVENQGNGMPASIKSIEEPPLTPSAIEKALRYSEARFRRLFEAAQDGILLLNAETGVIEEVNPFLIQLLGYSHDEFLGKTLWDIGAFRDSALSRVEFSDLQIKGHIRYDNLPLETKDGRSIPVEFVSNIYECAGINVIQCNVRDNTKRHLAEIELRATSRALKMLSESNVALVKATTETDLLNEYCRIAVETGGYRMAWIGFAAAGPEKPIEPIAHYGHEDGYLVTCNITWDETERGRGPVGRAIRTEQVQFVENIETDPSYSLWRVQAWKRGYRSMIALPFKLTSQTMACLNLYGARIDSWSVAERKLLQEIASDIGFGVVALRTAIAKFDYQEKLRESLEKTIQVIADTGEERDSYTGGHQRRVANICSKIAAEMGLCSDRIHGLHLAATIHDLGKIGIPAEILAKPRRLTAMEFGLIKEHPAIGYNIIKEVDFPWPIADIVLQHHERIDGSGYPRGLKRDDLLLESKILAVADVVEAMASHRPYRAALGIEAALNEIAAQRGIGLDERVVDTCLRIFQVHGYLIED